MCIDPVSATLLAVAAASTASTVVAARNQPEPPNPEKVMEKQQKEEERAAKLKARDLRQGVSQNSLITGSPLGVTSKLGKTGTNNSLS